MRIARAPMWCPRSSVRERNHLESSSDCPHQRSETRRQTVRFTQPMTWQDAWRSTFGGEPPMPTSREESVQDVLARLIAGSSCDWFRTYVPTAEGRAFLMSLWAKAFGGQTGTPEWFVSEYDMPVPIEWRGDINYTYRCVDLACGDDQQLLIVELKTERQSYRPDQIPDYLRLVRHRNPSHATDVVLLGPLRPGYTPARDDGQRYAELTWDDLPPLLSQAFPTDDRAHQLGRFVEAALLSTPSVRSPSLPSAAALGVQSVEPGDLAAGEADPRDETHTAVAHALRMAPSVSPGQRTRRHRAWDRCCLRERGQRPRRYRGHQGQPVGSRLGRLRQRLAVESDQQRRAGVNRGRTRHWARAAPGPEGCRSSSKPHPLIPDQ